MTGSDLVRKVKNLGVGGATVGDIGCQMSAG